MNTVPHNVMQAKTPPGIDYYIPHYLNLVWRWKWYICIVTPIVFLGCAFAAYKYGSTRPSLESAVTVQFVSNSTDRADEQVIKAQKENAATFIRSRSFLQPIVEKLSLQLSVEKYFRSDIFDSITIDKNAQAGQYDLKIDKDNYILYFSNSRLGIKNRSISTGKLFELSAFSFPSVHLTLTKDFLSAPHEVSFSILSMQQATERTSWSLSAKFPGREGQIGNVMTITFKGADYPLITQTVNTIADAFVENSAETKRDNTVNSGLTLEKQLEIARSDLANVEAIMRQFREQNPTVGGSGLIGSSAMEVSNLENSVISIQRAINEATMLQSRCKTNGNLDDQVSALFEATTFLMAHQSMAAPSLQAELNEASNEKRRVDADYSPQHPLVLENRKKLARVAANVVKALADNIDKMQSDVALASTKKSMISEEFQKMPAKEMRFAELERKRNILASLYSDLLSRYNISKMSETTSQGRNVFVVDHALVPMGPGRLQTMSQMLMMSMAIALALGLGIPAAADYLDKRARNEGDCKRFCSLQYLEGIPAKTGKKRKTKVDKDKLDDNLVSASFGSEVFDEMYRSLRTKILLRLHGEPHKMLVVTSLNASEGKSLTAANLSIVMAQQKLRTLLIDGDMRRGVQHNSFVLQKKPGLSDLLISPYDLSVSSVEPFLQKTHIPNLAVVTCGMAIPNPAECMNSNKFHDLVSIFEKMFDVIILDTPPLRVAVDAVLLPDAFNHYIIVVKAAQTNLALMEKKVLDFPGFRQKILGVVLNQATVDSKMHNYKYSYYHQ